MKNTAYRVSLLSLFVAFTLILSYIEYLLPITYGYGLKLGLPNIVIVSLLYVFSFKEAFIVNVLRIFITGLWFGNIISFIFSFCGGILSITIMFICKRIKIFDIITVSIVGALFHNIGQILAAFIVTDVPGIFLYLPVLIIGGIITGAVIGVLAKLIIKVLKEIFKNDSVFKR